VKPAGPAVRDAAPAGSAPGPFADLPPLNDAHVEAEVTDEVPPRVNDSRVWLSLSARDWQAPRAFLRMGDRLAFSNGIAILAVVSGAVLVAFAVHVSLAYWRPWGRSPPGRGRRLPYRALIEPLVRYIEALRRQRPGLTLTVEAEASAQAAARGHRHHRPGPPAGLGDRSRVGSA
jgi:hypothetical protein